AARESVQRHDARTTAASTRYSLGAVLYECLVGEPPFAGLAGDLAALLYSAVHRQPRIPKTVSPQAKNVLLLLLQKNPHTRLADLPSLFRLPWLATAHPRSPSPPSSTRPSAPPSSPPPRPGPRAGHPPGRRPPPPPSPPPTPPPPPPPPHPHIRSSAPRILRTAARPSAPIRFKALLAAGRSAGQTKTSSGVGPGCYPPASRGVSGKGWVEQSGMPRFCPGATLSPGPQLRATSSLPPSRAHPGAQRGPGLGRRGWGPSHSPLGSVAQLGKQTRLESEPHSVGLLQQSPFPRLRFSSSVVLPHPGNARQMGGTKNPLQFAKIHPFA
ncbi:hypothetical protein PTTG_27209, partial [Puccinia triticina 1-1 BBBD Race 1]